MKKTLIATVLVSSLTTASAFAADNSWEKEASDAWIDGKAEATLLFNGELNNFDINTDVKNGVVVLTGEVEHSVDKKLAEELVLGIDGVRDVKNELTIVNMSDERKKERNYESDSGFTDAKIATVIKSRYLFDTDVDGTDIDVDVEGLVVTLNGHVGSEAERDLAVQIAKNANDVKDVKDNLRITTKS
ncbi:BON domain-containing protein [Pseudoalteromonas piscicida]|uniref:BON domain-containing protein n=1 Tax=Pseudoalteromonas piscicida TaxID=43662 RepID=A0AAD0RJD8_PSEO7|nr:BON domain-containing protein [Pseudoalteromonas piscicida]ASD66373.1 transporter [Pseudoalteromonas piscicida]AXQ97291.1 BON domain-containing protein [Pseudoalteromonas piscicida]AXR02919.1 BON domain-containing protein [Pseudoalteromonas piscicida]